MVFLVVMLVLVWCGWWWLGACSPVSAAECGAVVYGVGGDAVEGVSGD